MQFLFIEFINGMSTWPLPSWMENLERELLWKGRDSVLKWGPGAVVFLLNHGYSSSFPPSNVCQRLSANAFTVEVLSTSSVIAFWVSSIVVSKARLPPLSWLKIYQNSWGLMSVLKVEGLFSSLLFSPHGSLS